MAKVDYMLIPLKSIPTAMLDYYNLIALAVSVFDYMEVIHGMYGLPQARALYKVKFIVALDNSGYIQ
jgi:hypothetical protein